MIIHVLSAVMPRLARGIQYAATPRLKHQRLWNTGSPGPVYAKASTRPANSRARRSFGEGGEPGDDIELDLTFEYEVTVYPA